MILVGEVGQHLGQNDARALDAADCLGRGDEVLIARICMGDATEVTTA